MTLRYDKRMTVLNYSSFFEGKPPSMWRITDDFKWNKTPAKAFTPPAEKKMGTRWSFVKKVNKYPMKSNAKDISPQGTENF